MEETRIVVCTAVVVTRDVYVLLLRRSPDASSWPGQWTFPGGRLEPGEGLRDCAARELIEETGLRLPSLELLTVTECDSSRGRMIGIVYRGHCYHGETPVNREPESHDAMGWFPFRMLPEPLMEGTRVVLAKLIEY